MRQECTEHTLSKMAQLRALGCVRDHIDSASLGGRGGVSSTPYPPSGLISCCAGKLDVVGFQNKEVEIQTLMR